MPCLPISKPASKSRAKPERCSRKYFERRIGFELKGEYDLVTEADRASEQLVIERLRAHFPAHSIVAEEGGGHTGSSEYCWYVDPLDGTTNFAHGFPMYNVTLALEQAGEMIAGVIFDPERNEMFTCERGSGAYLNNRRIRVSKVSNTRGHAGRHRISQPEAPSERQRAFLLSARDDHARRAARRFRGAGSGLCRQRPPGWVLGVWSESVGHGGGHAADREAGGKCSDMQGATAALARSAPAGR